MLPTYQNGDLVIVVRQAAYEVGDAAAYRVPAGELGAGRIVVHRISSADGDRFVMLGDNNPAPDPVKPAFDDMAGRVMVELPGAGNLVAWLFSPLIAGGLASALVVMVAVARVFPPTRGDQAITGAPA
jgi:signal peptidase